MERRQGTLPDVGKLLGEVAEQGSAEEGGVSIAHGGLMGGGLVARMLEPLMKQAGSDTGWIGLKGIAAIKNVVGMLSSCAERGKAATC